MLADPFLIYIKQLLYIMAPKCYNGSHENRSCGHCRVPPATPYGDCLESLQPGQHIKIYDTNAASPVLAASRVFLLDEC